MKGVAICNNDVVVISWDFDNILPNCLGFAIYRIDLNDVQRNEEALPTWMGFNEAINVDWVSRPSDVWPVQAFQWRDLLAKHLGTYQYRIVPMIGTPNNLRRLDNASLITNEVKLSPDCGGFSSYFNRGILSTQHLAHMFSSGPNGEPDYHDFIPKLRTPGDPTRNRLAGDMINAIKILFERAKIEKGQCYCALYELNDPELVELLINSSNYVHIILADAGKADATNIEARAKLQGAGIDLTNRMLNAGHIGHNKFIIYLDGTGDPQAVLTGSTNWTYTGLCGQSNNSILIESKEVASLYFGYWNRLKQDSAQLQQNKGSQGKKLRDEDSQPTNISLDNGKVTTTIWFSPNTAKATKPTPEKVNLFTPGDMKDLFRYMNQAKTGILFLTFSPGTPSIIDEAKNIQTHNRNLYIRGARTGFGELEKLQVHPGLDHRSALEQDSIIQPNPNLDLEETVISATAINDTFANYYKELLKLPDAFAVIHDKIVVIDPFSDNCVVITGSHNLGYKASYQNDENLLLIRGNQALAQSYAAHVNDIYEHYRWRSHIQKYGIENRHQLTGDDSWQKPYFDENNPRRSEMKFWTRS